MIHGVDEFKTCPDCAETVRAQARVCRFCGYRFDRRAAAGTAGSLAALIRRPQPRVELPDLLVEWGLELEEGEAIEFFGCCRLERAYGFLLLTSGRIAFFAGRHADRLLDWPLAEVALAGTSGPRWGRRLRLAGPDRAVTLRRFDSPAALAEVTRRLLAHAPS
jgi:hypothetical protein